MSSEFAWVAAIALLCAALGVLLWQRGARTQGQASAARFMESRIGSMMAPGHERTTSSPGGGISAPVSASTANMRAAAPAGGIGMSGARATASARGNAGTSPMADTPADVWRPGGRIAGLAVAFDNAATRAGLGNTRTPALALLIATAVISTWLALEAGVLAGTAAGVACVSAASFVVTARTQRRRLAIVQQLPIFLDGIVRLVSLGNSVPAAFQAALQTTEAPLHECLDRVSRGMRAGVEIDRALSQVGAVYGIREFALVGSVLRLSVKYGGRADLMLERMSVFMRDLEQADRELSAMSAETRLSAWVLAVLPLVIGGFLIASSPSYFSAMWTDPGGRKLVYIAFGMQVTGGYLLYRLTRLRS
ncbi:MAG TPA: type II secretion system F family protein [Trinickia sp.]|nr:type II secretion system F family protein [Trinickia sp.]